MASKRRLSMCSSNEARAWNPDLTLSSDDRERAWEDRFCAIGLWGRHSLAEADRT
jgi:hypothetical protein